MRGIYFISVLIFAFTFAACDTVFEGDGQFGTFDSHVKLIMRSGSYVFQIEGRDEITGTFSKLVADPTKSDYNEAITQYTLSGGITGTLTLNKDAGSTVLVITGSNPAIPGIVSYNPPISIDLKKRSIEADDYSGSISLSVDEILIEDDTN